MAAERGTKPETIEIDLLKPAAAEDAGLVERLTDLINEVYVVAEEGLWQPGWKRTNPEEVGGFVGAGEVATARLDGELAGVIRVQELSDRAGEFGMLAADPERRGIGIGRELVAFAERHIRDRGLGAMQLELLVPLEWKHPSKVFLDDWYTRIGYRVISKTGVADLQPQLAPLLATECEFVVYEKPL
jgi:GNAT superfamily N-acetyltransferase